MTERQQLEQAITAQESLRGTLDDAIIDATIATLKEKLAALEQAPQQRKQVTVLFMDVVGSTDIVHQLDPEDNLAIMDTALKRLSLPVEEHGGHVSRYMGDGFKAIFGVPVARENDPEMALRAGLGILAAAEEYAGEVAARWGIQGFQVRVGINTGLAVIGGHSEAEDTIAGTVGNLATRLESAAEAGTILISHESYKHVRGIFDFEPLEPIQAKGFPEAVMVYRVLRAKARPFYRGIRSVEGVETRMVGREA
jgi:class 3 adenylate cyclase